MTNLRATQRLIHSPSNARHLVGLVAIVALFTALACSGGKGKKATDTQPASGSSTPVATAVKAPAPAPASKLADLDSYRYNLKMTGQGGPLTSLQGSLGGLGGNPSPSAPAQDVNFEASGTYVKPDKAEMSMAISGVKINRTVIGKQEWSNFNGTTIGPSQTTSSTPEDLSLAVAFWDQGFLAGSKDFKCTGTPEMVNGVQTRKCSLDKQTFQQANSLGAVLPTANFKELTTFTFDAWLAEDKGYPVRFNAEMKGTDVNNKDFNLIVALEVTDINKPFDIKPPS